MRRFCSVSVLSLIFFTVAADARESKRANVAPAPMTELVVYRSPSCGCCGKWIDQMRVHGFRVSDHFESDMDAVKDRLGVPVELRSCHTAVVNGKVVEGHVPAAEVEVASKRSFALDGVAVPGMPAGSPGMEVGERRDAFDVLGFGAGGHVETIKAYPGH